MRSTLLLCQSLSMQVNLLSTGEIHYSFGSLALEVLILKFVLGKCRRKFCSLVLECS